ncbi:sensor histidine kinase [Rhizobium sp. AAP43]|uniref:sensor histidine kinase n=1 Tax=Rhizobium sp. AAP43 TaxID=1523420 RepID=UPI0006B9CB48|nr:sensor histidine kinase [Rhizobium sp. AAP43]KPF42082.1 histidine kinase [Rhizobium sp. AAP43]
MSKLARLLLGSFPTASIGTYLATMAALATLPLLGFVVFLLLELERSQFQALRVSTAQDAQTISRSVERRLTDLTTTLSVIADAPELKQGNLEAFHNRIGGSLKDSSLYVILSTRDGQQVLNTRVAWGAPLRPVSNPASVRSAIASGRTELSGVFFGATSQRWVVNLTRPLPAGNLPGGAEAIILTQDAATLGDLTYRENLPPEWTAALIDAAGRIIVSSGPDNRPSGSNFDRDKLDLLFGANNSAVFYREAEQYLMGYARVADWPWHVVAWGPVASTKGSFVSIWRSLLIGSLVFLTLSLGVVLVAAHQLRASIRRIAGMAERIGKGEIVSPETTKIVEANQVAVALSNASFDRAEAEERVHFILQELVHRTKNILSLVQAMMRQLARSSDSVEAYHQAVSGRLAGLAGSIEALARQQWGGIPLAKLIDLHLQTVVGSTDRVEKLGPDILANANAVQNLGLALHELATNSMKYGALSVIEGRISVEWWIEDPDADQPMLHLAWSERYGPPVEKPTRRGFGSTVIERHASSAFGGKVTMDFDPAGLRWTLVAPLSAFMGTA